MKRSTFWNCFKDRILIISVFVLLFLIPISSGYPFGSYELDGTWNTLTEASEISNAVTTPIGYPMSADLNYDNTTIETVIIDGNNVEIYSGNTLTALAGQTAAAVIDHAILHDIDSDNTLEVITTGNGYFSIFDFNGSHLALTVNYTIHDTSSEYMVGCYLTECVVFEADFTAGSDKLYARLFTAAGLQGSITVDTATNNDHFIFPFIRHVEVVTDSTDGGRAEYIITADEYPANQFISTYIVYENNTQPILEHSKQTFIAAADQSFSPPLVFDANPTQSGYEVVYAYQSSANDFVIAASNNDLSSTNTYTVLGFDEGQLVSNVIRMTAMTSSPSFTDFCAMGYHATNDEINMVCGNEITGVDDGLDVDVPYDLTGNAYTNIAPNNRLNNILISRVRTSSSTESGVNLDEVLTPYGIFSLDYGITDDLDFEYQFSGSQTDGSAIFFDYDGAGDSDIIYLTSDAVYYLDDGFQNTQVEIQQIDINTGNPICNGTLNVRVDVTISDVDDDTIRCVLYEKHTNETIKSVVGNQTTTSDVTTFYYDADEVGAWLLDIQCTDGFHTAWDQEIETVYVDTSASCNDWGEDPYTNIIITDVTDAEEVVSDVNAGLQSSLSDIPVFGSLFSSVNVLFIIWMIFLTAVVVSVYMKTGHAVPSVIAGIVMFVVGTVMTIIPAYYLLILGILSVTAVVGYIILGNRGD